ncbi:MAG TPA: ECF transporter S component [Acholeplasmataceae bacterium]|jgi:uncharacterized membrane protein|nr:ECF transporter S component [Acholeplasmataceae bacterium]
MNKEIKNIVLTSLFIALGIILPMVVHGFGQEVASAISPMHFPILLCGLILGYKYGLLCGVITPLLASFINGRPPLLPMATTMAFELGIYGLLSGLFYHKVKVFNKKIFNLYFALIIAMLAGRIVFAVVSTILPHIFIKLPEKAFIASFVTLFASGFIGIILQLLIIPSIVYTIEKIIYEKE